MESSISHYFNIMGVAQIRPLADYIFYSSKATMHIYSHTKFELSVDYIFYSSKATMHIYSHTKFELSVLITS